MKNLITCLSLAVLCLLSTTAFSQGCTDVTACNYDSTATVDDGSCTYPGCNDPIACNYDSAAGCDDGSCLTNDACGA